ncbi:MAG: bifunctional nuclease family protein [Bacteroidia bacterium]
MRTVQHTLRSGLSGEEENNEAVQEKIQLDIVGLSSSHSQIGHYALVLQETHGNRRLPIIIGGAEAQAIALELESIKTNRPMTHDLIYNLARHFHINLVEVIINDLSEGIFYARLIMEVDGDIHEIDSRPSDAVAIGVRFKVPIYSYERVLEEAGIVIDEEESGENKPAAQTGQQASEFSLAEIERSDPIEEEDDRPASRRRIPAKERLRKLQKQLDDAIAGEDYELAARLRDEISRITGD